MQPTETKQDYKLVPSTAGFGGNSGVIDTRTLSASEMSDNAVVLAYVFAEAAKNGSVEMLPSDPRSTMGILNGIVFRATESEAAKLNKKVGAAGVVFGLRPDGLISGGPR